MVVTGGVDRKVVVLNKETGVVAASLTGHTKKVNSVAFHQTRDTVASASHDGTVRLWSSKQGEEHEGVPKYTAAGTVRPHGGAEVVSVSIHPTNEYFASASLNGTWSFSDLDTQRVLATAASPTTGESIHSASFHPDGLIYGTGTGAHKVRIWDMKTLANVASFDGHTGAVRAISFSENGFYMASAAEDHTVRLWDLRKLKSFQTIEMPGSDLASIAFDYSGKYFAVGGSDISIYALGSKQAEHVVTLKDHTAQVTGVQFGQNAHWLVSTSLDRTLKFFGAQQ